MCQHCRAYPIYDACLTADRAALHARTAELAAWQCLDCIHEYDAAKDDSIWSDALDREWADYYLPFYSEHEYAGLFKLRAATWRKLDVHSLTRRHIEEKKEFSEEQKKSAQIKKQMKEMKKDKSKAKKAKNRL